jgi:hypothetical protein
MTRPFYFLIISLLLTIHLRAQIQNNHNDSVIIAPLDDYLKKLLSSKMVLYAIGGSPQSIIQLSDKITSSYPQQLLKSNSSIYIHLGGTGILYKGFNHSDTSMKFIRLDNTHNFNYNNGGYLFLQNENIFILGGYGFWKSNGLLKKFNYRDREWDVVPLSKEIYPPTMPKPALWYDKKENQIFLLYELSKNDALLNNSKENEIENKTYTLDLETFVWKEYTPLHKQMFELLKKGLIQMQHEKGFYFVTGIDLYWADIRSNRLYKMSDKSVSQSFFRIPLHELYYTEENKIFYRRKGSGKLDSLVLPMDKFVEEPYPIFRWSPPEPMYWSLFMAFLIGTCFITYQYLDRSQMKTKELISDPSIAGRFSTIEIALIELLINKSRKKQKANIDELNYVLGVKDKNTGLQKKVRSEAIHGINEKFQYMTGLESSLIISERSEADKRYFEYFIPKERIRDAWNIIKG